ncbi:MAG: tyrosine--tRNA ligase, partial [Candidatus Omnitrophota bacterium]
KSSLKLKIGFDPTACDIHLGHSVLLRKLRKIQELGHTVYLIIGDFTASVGDPSGRSELRPVLTKEEIQYNAKTYTDQAFKILDKKKTKIIFNSRWYKNMPVSCFLNLLSRYTVAQMLERDDFKNRMHQHKPLSLQELVYPIIQGYDSVMMEADIEFGGTDQKFNLIVGRYLQESYGQTPQVIVTMPLLVGLDGKNKMSKSLGNYVAVTENAKSMFGKIMSISDELMWEYFAFLIDVDVDKAKKMHPKEAKSFLAEEIVKFYHSSKIAKEEKEAFEKIFSQRQTPEDIPVYYCESRDVDLIEALFASGMVASRNEGRRLLDQKGISCDGRPLAAPCFKLPSGGMVLKIGKRRFLKIARRS